MYSIKESNFVTQNVLPREELVCVILEDFQIAEKYVNQGEMLQPESSNFQLYFSQKVKLFQATQE
jgi:hypothetical protein